MPHDIVETAQGAGTFQTLRTAVDAAGLGDSLADGGPFTVFAPTDDAFATLPQETVKGSSRTRRRSCGCLTYHVVAGRLTTAQITHDSEQKTVEGGVLNIAVNGSVTVNDATVIRPGVEAKNGVIHIIDRVLILAA